MPQDGRGWHRESARHALAAKGIKTGRQANNPRKTGRKPVSFSEHNWAFKDDGERIEVRLGNWTDAGWHWDGNEDEMVGFLIRMAKAREGIRGDFLEKMKAEGIDFNMYKSVLLEAVKDGDGLYEASGDNRLWHFGDYEVEIDEDEMRYFAEDSGWSDEKLDAFLESDAYWTYAEPDVDFDTYENEMKDDWIRDMKQRIEMADSWEDFMDEISGEGFQYDWMFEERGGYRFYEQAHWAEVPKTMKKWEEADWEEE